MKATIELPQTQLILEIITETLGDCTVYVFGYKLNAVEIVSIASPTDDLLARAHLYLLVFVVNADPLTAGIISNQIHESCTGIAVTILLHRPTDIATKLLGQQWFFYKILREGQRLCLDKKNVPYWPHDWVPKREDSTNYWLKCEAVANFYISAAADSAQFDLELVKISLLHQAAEQIALAIIRVFLGYTPNVFGLSYLLNLSAYITPLATQLFPKATAGQERRYKMLCSPPTMLRHWCELHASEEDFTVLMQGCTEFLDGARGLISAELKKLETNQK